MKNQNVSPFETIHSEKRPEKYFTFVRDQVMVNGQESCYEYMELREGVCVLPFHGKKVITLREYRYPIRSWQRELPSGLIEVGETPQEAAVRELEEETGYLTDQLIDLGAFYPSFGSTNEIIYLFAAVCSEAREQRLDDTEVLEIEELTLEELKELVASGEFMHGAGIAALARYSLRQ